MAVAARNGRDFWTGCASLRAAGITVYELGGVKSNPRLDLVYEGINICRSNSIGFILAVGGGSVIDSAKTIARYAEQRRCVGLFPWQKDGPSIASRWRDPYNPGRGERIFRRDGYYERKTMAKLSYGDDRSRPVFSILNPEITYTVPAYHTAAGITDAIAL